jgi:hypothetical protein
MEPEVVMVQLREGVIGPFPVRQLHRLSGFTPQTYVSFPGTDKWAPAFRVLSLNSYEPPIAGLDSVYEPMMAKGIPKQVVFDWKAKGSALGWVDRWFRRLAIFNTILAAAAYAAWSYPPIRVPIEKELRIQVTVQWRRWRPVIAPHWKLPIELPLVPFTSTKVFRPSSIGHRTH